MKKVLLIGFMMGFATSARADKLQVWENYGVEIGINDHWSNRLNGEFKWKGLNDFFLFDVHNSLRHKVNQNLSLAFGYKFERAESKSVWKSEHRPDFEVGFKEDFGWAKFSNRNRIEYRLFKSNRFIRNRHRFKLARALSSEVGGFVASVANEFLIVPSRKNIGDQNRATTGISKGFLENRLKAGLSYLWLLKRTGRHWLTSHGVITALSYRI